MKYTVNFRSFGLCSLMSNVCGFADIPASWSSNTLIIVFKKPSDALKAAKIANSITEKKYYVNIEE